MNAGDLVVQLSKQLLRDGIPSRGPVKGKDADTAAVGRGDIYDINYSRRRRGGGIGTALELPEENDSAEGEVWDKRRRHGWTEVLEMLAVNGF